MASEKDKLKKPYELPLRGAKTFRKAVVGEDGVDAELLQAAVEQEYHQVRLGMSADERAKIADQLLAFSDGKRLGTTFMDKLGDKLTNYGITPPAVEIAYHNLNVSTEASVGSAAIPTVISPVVGATKRLLKLSKTESQKLQILNNVSGVLKPGRMTLLLGPPACGKSTLLKLLAGRLTGSSAAGLDVSGEVTYNGQKPDSFDVVRTCAFVNQMDNHEPNLSVRESMEFAYLCQTGTKGPGFNLPLEILKAKVAAGIGSGPSVSTTRPHIHDGVSHAQHSQAQSYVTLTEITGALSPTTTNGGRTFGQLSAAQLTNGQLSAGQVTGYDGSTNGNGRHSPDGDGSEGSVVPLPHTPTRNSVDAHIVAQAGNGHGNGKTISFSPGVHDGADGVMRNASTTSKGGASTPKGGAAPASPGAGMVGRNPSRLGGGPGGLLGSLSSRKLLPTMSSRRLSKKQRQELIETLDSDEFEHVLRQAWGTGVRVELVMKLMGLFHARGTLVGNEINRGISGGEKKRLTTAEQIVGPRNVLLLDEISTGLDSATLFSVIRWLSKWTHAAHSTTVITLLQPPPEVYQLFDDVMIMTEGSIIYHGPVGDAVPFFTSLGFSCPVRKDIPSFLLEVTTPKGQLEYASRELRVAKGLPVEGDISKVSKGLRNSLLVPLEDMIASFWSSNAHGVTMAKELAAPPEVIQSHSAALVKKGAGYPLSPMEAILVATRRQVTLVLRDKVLLKGRAIQVTVISLISASLFYRLPVDLVSARTYFGLCFLFVLFINFGGFPQLPLTIEAKKVWFKYRENGFIPAYAQGLAMGLAQFPLSIIEATIFSLIMYFMVYLYQEAGHFFTFFLISISCSLVSSALFRFLGCVSPNQVIANAAAGIVLVCLIITSGFAILRTNIPPWMIWAYWISPFAWGLRCFAINELTTPKWQNDVYPDNPALTLGEGALLSFDFYTDRRWIWAGIGYNIGIYVICTIGCIFALWLQQPQVPHASLPDKEEVEAARKAAEEHRQHLAAVREAAAKSNTGEGMHKAITMNRIMSRGVGAVEVDIASSLPFDPITLVFRNIKYTVPNPHFSRKAQKQAVKNYLQQHPELQEGDLEMGPTTLAVKSSAPNSPSHNNNNNGLPRPPDAPAPPPSAPPPVTTGRRSSIGGGGSREGSVHGPRGKLEVAASLPESLPGNPDVSGPIPLELAAQERLTLLNGITGYSEPGVLMALMGGSGAGKTTLMDCLAGRKTIGEISGDIMVNGHPKDQKTWARVVGYCEQNDIHTPAATVKEALIFSARLRLPASITDDKVRAYVDEVMDIVDLIDIQYNLVGMPGVSGLSVEQRKRLTIAVELVANPSVIFLDEPTSGLDARAAAIVMTAVRNLARNGRTVMVTIHQPSIEIFEAFDMLLLIQRGGRTTYFGPLGDHSANLINYLTSVPGTPPLPPGYNPATWMLEVTGGSMATMVEAVNVDWPDVYARSQLATDAARHADDLIRECAQTYQPLQVSGRYAMPFRVQLAYLWQKFQLLYWRSPGYNLTRIIMTFLTAFIYAAIYWKQGDLPSIATIGNIQAVMGIMYSSTNFNGMTNLMSVMPVVGYERVVFYRERAASMYNPFAYGFAMSAVEIPYILLQTLIFVPTIYWMVGFAASAEMFFYYLIMFALTIMFYNVFGQTLVYITPNQGIAQVVAGGLNFLWNIFNGFIITYPDIPRGWKWMNRLAPSTWIMYGLGASQLSSETVPIFYNGQQLTVRAFMDQYFGYLYWMRWWCMLIVVAYILFLRVASILALRYWNFLKR